VQTPRITRRVSRRIAKVRRRAARAMHQEMAAVGDTLRHLRDAQFEDEPKL
jgi:hypothetical protein